MDDGRENGGRAKRQNGGRWRRQRHIHMLEERRRGNGGEGDYSTTALLCLLWQRAVVVRSLSTVHHHPLTLWVPKRIFPPLWTEGGGGGGKRHQAPHVFEDLPIAAEEGRQEETLIPPICYASIFLCGFSAGNGSLSPKCLAMTPSPSAAAIHVCVCVLSTHKGRGERARMEEGECPKKGESSRRRRFRPLVAEDRKTGLKGAKMRIWNGSPKSYPLSLLIPGENAL